MRFCAGWSWARVGVVDVAKRAILLGFLEVLAKRASGFGGNAVLGRAGKRCGAGRLFARGVCVCRGLGGFARWMLGCGGKWAGVVVGVAAALNRDGITDGSDFTDLSNAVVAGC